MPYYRKTLLEIENDEGNFYRVRELRVTFSLTLSVQPDPPSSVIRVYNMSPSTEDRVLNGAKASFYAGYRGNRPLSWIPPKIFQGTIIKKESERQGTERVFKLTLDEAYREKTLRVIGKTWGYGLSPRLIARDIASEMGYSTIVNSDIIPTDVRSGNFTAFDPAGKALTRLLSP